MILFPAGFVFMSLEEQSNNKLGNKRRSLRKGACKKRKKRKRSQNQ